MLTMTQWVVMVSWVMLVMAIAVLWRGAGAGERFLLILPLSIAAYTIIFYLLLLAGYIRSGTELALNISSAGRLLEVILFGAVFLLRIKERFGTK